MKITYLFTLTIALIALSGCAEKGRKFTGAAGEITLMTVDPGHFHAALVQKRMYPQISPDVYVYASQGEDLTMHLRRIETYNSRAESPTSWNEIVYAGDDFYRKMLKERKGNLLMLAGNNGKKMEYILGAMKAGINVLSDKPMAIHGENYQKLVEAFEEADKNGVLLYDIMTQRYEVTNALQRDLATMSDVFGPIEKGTLNDPAIIKESVHYFSKTISGIQLIRPEWYFDVTQQGEGIVDVMTHLVDLVQWTVVGETPIDIGKQVRVNRARHWTTPLSLVEYRLVTGSKGYAPFLSQWIINDTLHVFANGEIAFSINGVNSRVAVYWNFAAPEGSGDTHYAVVRCGKCDLIIRQNMEQNYKPVLYIAIKEGVDRSEFEAGMKRAVDILSAKYAGITVAPDGSEWKIIVPDGLNMGHEAHFGYVTEKYLNYLVDGALPAWEVANMQSKYFITTTAFGMAQ